MSCPKNSMTSRHTPVSYTHLDVYKRQLIPFAAALIILGVIFSRMTSVMARASEALSRMNAVMVEYVRGMRVIKALNMGSRSFRRFQSAVDEEHSVWCEISRKTGPGYAAFLVVIECGMLVMVPLGGLMFTSGAISGATFLLFAFVGSLYPVSYTHLDVYKRQKDAP